MKKFVLILIAAGGMIYAACSGGQHSATVNHNPPATDTAMGGDAMKHDSAH